jgi:hypothetical protein
LESSEKKFQKNLLFIKKMSLEVNNKAQGLGDSSEVTALQVNSVQTPAETGVATKHPLRCYQILFPLMNMARAFMYDVPMIMSVPLKNTMGLNDDDIQWCYSSWYIPAILCNVIYGIIMRKVGPEFTYVALGAMMVGHITFWVGIPTGQFWMIIFGRVLMGAGGEGSLVSQTYVVKRFTKGPNVVTLISGCKMAARVAMLLCYYGLPQIYFATGGFFWPMMVPAVILVISTGCFTFYLASAKKNVKLAPEDTLTAPLTTTNDVKKEETNHSQENKGRCDGMRRLNLTYYLLLVIRFCCLGAWFGFSAMFMQYLVAGCLMEYKNAAQLLVFVPFISLLVVVVNTFVTRYFDYLTEALLFCTCLVSAFLWVSGLYVEKGTGMVVFALVAMSLSGGWYNLCIDSYLTKSLPRDMASIGSALSITVKGVACILFPIINGAIMGAKATQETMASCCLFMAVPSTIGCVFCWWFYFQNRADKAKKRRDSETAKAAGRKPITRKLTHGEKLDKNACDKVVHNDL